MKPVKVKNRLYSQELPMRVLSLEIAGLRSVQRASLTFDQVTVLIGGNNAGKSTLLYALQLFFEAAPKLTVDDFHRRETESIEITVTFDHLTASEMEEFGSAVIEGKLTVSRTLSNDKDRNLSYSVKAQAYQPFLAIRQEGNRTNLRTAYNALADVTEGLDRVASADQAIENMERWELAHPEQLEATYVRGFFGAPKDRKSVV
jgi:predicted ATP-dependent endonuclease of OLD family